MRSQFLGERIWLQLRHPFRAFRVQVVTSTVWGIVGIALIGGALLVMMGAVVWFGRR